MTSNFSFLRGASHPEELVNRAAELGYSALAITDRNTLAGIVRAHVAAKACHNTPIPAKARELRLIPACRLELLDGPALLAYPTDTQAYARLSGLLTTGNLRAEKGQCSLYKHDVYEAAKGIKFVVAPGPLLDERYTLKRDFAAAIEEYREAFGRDLYLGASRGYRGDDAKQLYRLAELGKRLETPLLATNDIYFHAPGRRPLQDVLTCIREKCTIHNAGFRLFENAERYLKPIEEMHRLFRHYPDAVKKTLELAEACQFSLDSLQYVYPEELTTNGRTPQEELTHLAWEGARSYYGEDIPQKVSQAIRHELAFIEERNYAPFFLTVYDLCRFARQQKILYQGRGSAANSTICYCLQITFVNPTKFDLLFERFMSAARNEPPDIDVDFEHERREEVIQYVYRKYGRDRAAIVATVTQLHYKGAVRDVGKAMGLSRDMLDHLSKARSETGDRWLEGKGFEEAGLNASDPMLRQVLALTTQLMGFPRQLGQHTGGFVITQKKLADLCPLLNARMEDRTNIEWNKDDIDALGIIKVDVLALGMLTCIRKAFALAREHHGMELTLANIPQDDPAVYEMISHADTIGVFQIESRAQQAMLPRLRPECFYDLVIEVAIVRPGPIQGDMVHPYLRRRNKEEPVEFPSKELEEILGRTLGVPLFQEQAMKIAIVAAGYSAAEADQLRRSMATFKAHGMISRHREKLVTGMVAKGYSEDYANRIFKQLEGFGSYGFPESHAVSFALLAYISAWLKRRLHDVFSCALLNSQPMGFYHADQLVTDAKRHGVPVRPIDVNFSQWDNTLEEKVDGVCAMRLGFRQVRGLGEAEVAPLLKGKPYRSVNELLDAGVSVTALERLANADAFGSLGLDRRRALWEVSALKDHPIGVFAGQPSESEQEGNIPLPTMPLPEQVTADYAATALSLKAHPVSFFRSTLDHLGIRPIDRLRAGRDGQAVKVAGRVRVRQHPGTAKGVLFITIEDETGDANLVVFPKVFEAYRKPILQSTLLMVEGRLQVEGEVIHVLVKACHNLSSLFQQASLFGNARNFR
ncbi:error-prone DNA polymerase [Puia sp.]|uniref:error-prone DNA polymerase n=1 Tax=Puia sp. TaxID=2045100 RepID=UPI002D7E3CD5|nr:error-prone DNA polymerase [Puia sp.]